MLPDPRIDAALRSADPLSELRALAEEMLGQGMARGEVQASFEASRGPLREQGRDDDEDRLLEVMDFVAGWCSPHMRLGRPG